MQKEWTLGKITVGLRWSRDVSGTDHIERSAVFCPSAHRRAKGTAPGGRSRYAGVERDRGRDRDPLGGD
jgi:hypothetical protein